MKIISFIETNQPHVIEAILRHTGLWTDPKYRGPPKPYHPPAQARPSHPQLLHTRPDGNLLELDPEFLEHRRREQSETLFD